jgi:hypothetical protein
MQWTIYNDTTTPFVEPLVLSLIADAHGSVWFGTWDAFAFRGRLWRHEGSSWTNVRLDLKALPSSFPEAIAIMDDGTVWLGTSGTTGGNLVNVTNTEWVAHNRLNSGLPASGISSLAADGTVLWIGTGSGLVRYDGSTWNTFNAQNSDLPEDFVLSVAVDKKGNTWAGTIAGGVAVFKQGGVVTDALITEAGAPYAIGLLQNYPNPFNGTTTISFSLPSPMVVSLKVYDLLGREVGTLVQGPLEAGLHKRRWDAPVFASGVYYYCLRTSASIRTNRLVILR